MKWAAPLVALALAGCANETAEPAVITLPSPLREISGLSVASEDSVFTHNDEHAIVYEIGIADGRIRRIFALGDPTIEGDFEGIAYAAGQVYLTTSDGMIYAAVPAAHGQRAAYRVYDTGLGPVCEVEGLSSAPTDGHLLLVCKKFHQADGQPRLEIYRWALGAQRAEPEPWLSVPLSALLEEDQIAAFRPSSIEWDEGRSRLIIVSGKSQAFLQIDLQGHLIDRQRLDAVRHRQTEGLAILPGCRLLLADEGTDTRAARITVYPCPD